MHLFFTSSRNEKQNYIQVLMKQVVYKRRASYPDTVNGNKINFFHNSLHGLGTNEIETTLQQIIHFLKFFR